MFKLLVVTEDESSPSFEVLIMAKKKSTAKASAVAATNSGVRRFELVQGASSKFWEVSQNGSEFTVRFGRIGTEGQSPKPKDAGSPEKATAAIEKLIREKTGKGYAEVGGTTKAAGSNAANKTAPASVKEKDKHLLTAEIATRFLRTEEDLDTFKMIEDEAAKILSKYKDSWLQLNGLKKLSDAAAESLSKFKGNRLDLNSLTSLSDAAADHLGKFKGRCLHLSALKSLSDAAVESLCKFRGGSASVDTIIEIELDGLTSLSDVAAESLGRFKGRDLILKLNGLKSLSDAAAESLSKDKGEYITLELNGLKCLSDRATESLGKSKAWTLQLDGLTSLSEAAAENLSKFKGRLYLNGLKGLSAQAAMGLSLHQDNLYLLGLGTLSNAAATNLAKHRGSLALSSHFIESLSDEAVIRIAQHTNICSGMIDGLSSKAKQRLRWGKQVFARNSNGPLFPELSKAREFGVTSIRTIWDGHGDDGCFEHQLFKKDQKVNVEASVDADVEAIVQENAFVYEGEGNGSVGVLELDLLTGQGTWRGADHARDVDRLAEFLLQCQWISCTSLTAKIAFLVEDDVIQNVVISNLAAKPSVAVRPLKDGLSRLAFILAEVEASGKTLVDRVRSECGDTVQLEVNISDRTFAFAGCGKKVSVKVPDKALGLKYFTVDLGSSSGTKSKTAKKGTK